jgi:hypothetical protein
MSATTSQTDPRALLPCTMLYKFVITCNTLLGFRHLPNCSASAPHAHTTCQLFATHGTQMPVRVQLANMLMIHTVIQAQPCY